MLPLLIVLSHGAARDLARHRHPGYHHPGHHRHQDHNRDLAVQAALRLETLFVIIGVYYAFGFV